MKIFFEMNFDIITQKNIDSFLNNRVKLDDSFEMYCADKKEVIKEFKTRVLSDFMQHLLFSNDPTEKVLTNIRILIYYRNGYQLFYNIKN